MTQLRRRFFDWLYYAIFGEGLAYEGIVWWELAEIVKRMSR